MAKVYIKDYAVTEDERQALIDIVHQLASEGHEIDYFENAFERDKFEDEVIAESQVIIVLMSSLVAESKQVERRTVGLISIYRNQKLVIPVMFPTVDYASLAFEIRDHNLLFLTSLDRPRVENISTEINNIITRYMKRLAVDKEKTKEVKQNIKTSAQDYISTAKKELKKREKNLALGAIVCFIIAFMITSAGIKLIYYFTQESLDSIKQKTIQWPIIAYASVKNILILSLALAAMNYSFKLARQFMAESLKIANRLHAINYGDFFLSVFNNDVSKAEFKDAFVDWNIKTPNSFFDEVSDSVDELRALNIFSKGLEKFKDITDKSIETAVKAKDVVKASE